MLEARAIGMGDVKASESAESVLATKDMLDSSLQSLPADDVVVVNLRAQLAEQDEVALRRGPTTADSISGGTSSNSSGGRRSPRPAASGGDGRSNFPL